VEQPIRQRRLLAQSKSLLQTYGTGLAVTMTIFALVIAGNGLPQRFPSEVSHMASYVNDKSPPLAECAYTGQALSDVTDFCQIGKPGETPRWLVYGDSHAWAAHAAFDKWLRLKGEAGLFMYRSSCPPVMGLHVFGDKGRCFAFNRALADFLRKSAAISTVVLVSTWRQAADARLSTSADTHLSKEDSLDLFDKKFSTTLRYLDGIGKRIYVWEPVPGASRSVPLALARAALEGRPADLQQREGRIVRQGNQNPGVQIIRYCVEQSFDGAVDDEVGARTRRDRRTVASHRVRCSCRPHRHG
jgi:hypothetical protein